LMPDDEQPNGPGTYLSTRVRPKRHRNEAHIVVGTVEGEPANWFEKLVGIISPSWALRRLNARRQLAAMCGNRGILPVSTNRVQGTPARFDESGWTRFDSDLVKDGDRHGRRRRW